MSTILRYEIEEITNAVRVFYPDSDVASLFQPDWPDGTEWKDYNEANGWAKEYLLSLDPDSLRYAPVSPGILGQLKVPLEENQ